MKKRTKLIRRIIENQNWSDKGVKVKTDKIGKSIRYNLIINLIKLILLTGQLDPLLTVGFGRSTTIHTVLWSENICIKKVWTGK